MFAYCRNNPVRRVDISGAADADCIDEDGELLSSEDLEAHNGGGGIVTLYRAVSPAESHSAVSTQRFSTVENAYEDGKYFATSQTNAQKWGDAMYADGNYEVISGTFDIKIVSNPNTIFYPRLDGIGSAYLIPISVLNESVIRISCMS